MNTLLKKGMFIALLPLLSYIPAYGAGAMQLEGVQVKSVGTLMSPADQAKITNLLLNDPASLSRDTNLILQTQLKQKRKALKAKIGEKYDKARNQRLLQARKTRGKADTLELLASKLKRLRKAELPYVGDEYADALFLHEFLLANPFFIKTYGRMVETKVGATALEEGAYTPRELKEAFNDLTNMVWEGGLSFDEYMQKKKIYDKPLYKLLLNIPECFSCLIARLNVPFVRGHIENEIVNAVKSMHPNKKDTIVLTDYSRGDLFETFLIINKLIAEGYNNIRLNLIDPAYVYVIETLREMADKPASHIVTIPDNLVSRLYTQARIEDAEETTNLLNALEIGGAIRSFDAFNKWFNGIPGANVKLWVYSDHNDYIKDATAVPTLKSDVVFGVGYYDVIGFEQLRRDALKPAGHAFSLANISVQDPTTLKKKPQFFYSHGGQADHQMIHAQWDLKNRTLTPVDVLPPIQYEELPAIEVLGGYGECTGDECPAAAAAGVSPTAAAPAPLYSYSPSGSGVRRAAEAAAVTSPLLSASLPTGTVQK